MLTTEQIEKIIKLAWHIENASNDLAVEYCEGYSYSGIEQCKRDLNSSKEELIAYLNELKE
ncbi:molybdopterin-guanine dinucleotide biosynthesis protein [Yersinia phage vB_YenM_P8]|nr:molybdopterin-guanine dinucleotide biosynthesis protein [Escherichia phage UPEC07]